MQFVVHPDFIKFKKEISDCLNHFSDKGNEVYKGSRNKIKAFHLKELELNIKAFKKPNIIKKIIYTYFRESKAKRSYEYALKLLEFGINTPQPIAYVEKRDALGLTESYYACEHIEYDMMFRKLVAEPDLEHRTEILNQFTQFCFKLHENGIEFKDHSPGNTLIKYVGHGNYDFYLVDLNRMTFHKHMSLKQRMHNLRRLTPQLEMVSLITEEYAKLSGENSEKLFKMLWEQTSDFQRKFHRKQRMKQKFK